MESVGDCGWLSACGRGMAGIGCGKRCRAEGSTALPAAAFATWDQLQRHRIKKVREWPEDRMRGLRGRFAAENRPLRGEWLRLGDSALVMPYCYVFARCYDRSMSLRASQKTPFQLSYWTIRVSENDLGSANGIRVNVRIL
jgi:hypothetical protein